MVTPATRPVPPATIPFREALRFWLKLGFVSFGGPAGQIALMHAELVERRRWISERRFLHALNYCMLLPGPEAQQLATYVGWLLHRTWGGIVAGVLFVLPSLLLLVVLAWLYLVYGDLPLVQGAFRGIKPAVTAIVLQAAWRIGGRTLHHPLLWAIAIAAFVAIFALQLPFPMIVIGAGLVGALAGRLFPAAFDRGGSHDARAGTLPGAAPADAYARAHAAVVDDDTPTPDALRFRPRRLAFVAGSALALWIVPMALLAWTQGWDGTLTRMGLFFTQAALLTFGGAYAVLPYVWQGAVIQYGWLTPAQMIDGLALGESTPGPLIMVVAFVAFVGGWSQAPLGPGREAEAAVLAALLVTWFTFLPSFLFVLAGGPLIEATRGTLAFTAPLTAITAAVVGVIVNLALFFAWHVLWPSGAAGPFDAFATLLAVAAALALMVARRGILEVIAACAAAGLLFSLLG